MNPLHQFDRRDFLKLGTTGALSLVLAASDLWQTKPVRADELRSNISPDTALQMLMEGNQRFMWHHPQYPDQSERRLHETAQEQHPFATILCCADSRVPVELIFDRGVGDVFDVRIAGNIATPEVIGSIEYAVALLGTPILMVLGHERCGAVTAAVKNKVLPGDISTFVKAIQPAVEKVKNQSGDTINNAVIANVYLQIERLKQSLLLKERLDSGLLKIVGGRYDLDTGRVTILT